MSTGHSHALKAAIVIISLLTASFGLWGKVSSKALVLDQRNEAWVEAADHGGYILHETAQGIGCREATFEEAQPMSVQRRIGVELHTITPLQPQAANGLTIVLRATEQLESSPAAKNAYIRAAARWESIIASPLTIIIDVDFGPKNFGVDFPPLVLGQTRPQLLFSETGYPAIRSALISGGSTQEAALYAALPAASVPTDLGSVVGVATPSADLRALGILNAVADPASEPGFGNPPFIALNSNVSFDFNPDDGIDSNMLDFDAVATHEIGHALGFASDVGARELDSELALAVSVWDIFRFRTGVSLGTFSTAQRVLSSGEIQVFFAGTNELQLATGRPDGSGGDGDQASHWKENSLTGTYIGIMDPAIARGERNEITASDRLALDAFGYQLKTGPVVNKVVFDSNVPIMVIKGTGFSSPMQLEVNGLIVAPPLVLKVKGSGAKVKISGTASQLNLRLGVNNVVLLRDGSRSNVFVLSL